MRVGGKLGVRVAAVHTSQKFEQAGVKLGDRAGQSMGSGLSTARARQAISIQISGRGTK
jgi:hypothetical protein